MDDSQPLVRILIWCHVIPTMSVLSEIKQDREGVLFSSLSSHVQFGINGGHMENKGTKDFVKKG